MYYFHVQPFDKDGIFTGDEYEERSAMPLFSGLRSAPHASNTSTNDKTPPVLENKNGTREVAGRNGPEHIFLLFVGLSFALAMFSFNAHFSFFEKNDIHELFIRTIFRLPFVFLFSHLDLIFCVGLLDPFFRFFSWSPRKLFW